MPRLYTTKQGQTVDLVCQEHYGRTAEVTELVLAANPGISAMGPFLPLGTTVTLPDVATQKSAPKLTSLWD